MFVSIIVVDIIIIIHLFIYLFIYYLDNKIFALSFLN